MADSLLVHDAVLVNGLTGPAEFIRVIILLRIWGSSMGGKVPADSCYRRGERENPNKKARHSCYGRVRLSGKAIIRYNGRFWAVILIATLFLKLSSKNN